MAAKPKHAGGRPSSYRPEFSELGRKLCLLGADDAEMASIMGVSEVTLNAWKKQFPKFLKSLQEGKAAADANVAARMYERALGYSHPEVHVSSYEGSVTLTPLVKHYPPDTQAASLWLRNRQPKKWRDKIDHEVTGKDGDPIAVKHTLDDTTRALLDATLAAGSSEPE